MGDARGLTFLCAVTLILGACDEPTSVSNRPWDSAQDPPVSLADPEEQVIRELEQYLAGLADQVRQMSVQGVVEFYPEVFTGTPLLADPPPQRRVDRSIPGFRIETWEGERPIEVRRDQIAGAVAGFLKPVATIEYARMKIESGKWKGLRYEAKVKFVLDATLPSGGRWAIRGRYWTEFEKAEEAWRIVKQTRLSGRRVGSERPVFVDVTESLNLELDRFPPRLISSSLPFFDHPFHNLGGVAVGDIDGDGFADVLINRVGERRLFRNVEGRRFEDVTREAGIFSEGIGSTALFLDYDNDGDLDLLALSYAAEKLEEGSSMFLFSNDGTGRFKDVTEEAGMEDEGPAVLATAADIDVDGDLDIYVTLYERLGGSIYSSNPREVLNARNAAPNRLWINNGNGTFTESAREAGVDDTGWSFAAAFGDYNDDGLPDLYVVNDFGNNRLYRNQGSGKFEDVTETAGVGDVGFGMGADWGDYDGDGRLDLYVSNMYSTAGNRILGRGAEGLSEESYRRLLKAARGNTLLRNRGDGTFEDVTEATGVGPAGWGWDTHFFDYNNDGWQDLYVANGYLSGESKADL